MHLIDNFVHTSQRLIIVAAMVSWVVGLASFVWLRRTTPSELRGKESGAAQLLRLPWWGISGWVTFVGIVLGEFLLIKIITVAALREIKPRLTAEI